jgi:hypothetical protein
VLSPDGSDGSGAGIVGGEHVETGVLGDEGAQPGLVVDAQLPVRRDDLFEQPDPERAPRGGLVHLTGVEEGVSGIQQPALVGLHSDAAVAHGVSGQRDEQDLRREAVELTHGLNHDTKIVCLM